MDTLLLVGAVLLASAVEMVEARTMVLAVRLPRGWRSALIGVTAALGALGPVAVSLGPSLVRYAPLRSLQVMVGTLVLIFGLQWLRKAILRAAGLKAKHNETLIFQRELDQYGAMIPLNVSPPHGHWPQRYGLLPWKMRSSHQRIASTAATR